MRFSVKLKLKEPKVPHHYRTAFVSYLKKLLEGTPYFDLYYTKKFPKPFTFAVFLPIKTIEKDAIYLQPSPSGETFLTWNLSFADPKLALTLLAKLTDQKGRKHNWRNLVEFELLGVEPKEEKFPEGASKITVKTLSPVYLKAKNGKTLLPDDPAFEAELNAVQAKVFKTLGLPYEPIKFRVKTCEGNGKPCYKKRVVKVLWREGGERPYPIDAFDGTFELEGPPEVLKNLYRKGLGQRTAQGFGMIEVIRQ
ncbi:MAG: CRISPR-associated endoribonuclease Cas6, partial [Aquificae bacterium]|nr:CRISPR-associated endoribonuclease Cas6 [Aquificota bacterium]